MAQGGCSGGLLVRGRSRAPPAKERARPPLTADAEEHAQRQVDADYGQVELGSEVGEAWLCADGVPPGGLGETRLRYKAASIDEKDLRRGDEDARTVTVAAHGDARLLAHASARPGVGLRPAHSGEGATAEPASSTST